MNDIKASDSAWAKLSWGELGMHSDEEVMQSGLEGSRGANLKMCKMRGQPVQHLDRPSFATHSGEAYSPSCGQRGDVRLQLRIASPFWWLCY